MADLSPANAAPARDLDAALATPEPAPRRRRPSLVWLMPLLAVLVAVWVVWQNYQDRGPLITVLFPSASGIQAGATELRIRDIRVGVVEEVGFTGGMAAVEATIRVDKSVAQYVDADAQFWLVEPQVSARGVTGIGTILSGVYIEADWDGAPGAPATEFTALANPPLSAFAEEGTRVILRTRAGGQLAAGAPVLATGIEVGRIGQPVLSESGNTVTMEAFIAAPYDRRLTTNSRFWDASGLSVNVGTGGLDLRVDSLAALLEGGVNFGTPVTGGEPVGDGYVFDVFASEAAARADAFEGTTDPDIPVSILLDADVSGLGIGTLVRFRGVKAGEVTDVVGVAPEGEDGRVRLLIDMNIQPTRIGLRPGLSPAQLREVLAARVARGLRMRLSSEGLFGQTVVIELANVADAAPAELTDGPDGRLIFPTTDAVQSEGTSGVEGLVARVQRLPIEDVMTAAAEAMTSVSRLAGAAEGVLLSDGVRELPATIDGTLGEVQGLVADVREGGAIESFNATLRSVEGTMASVNQAATALPEIVEDLSGTAESTLANVSELAGTASDVLASDGVTRLPATVDATLAEVQGLVSEFREGGAIESLNATLRSAESTLASVDAAARSLPETVASLSQSATETLGGVARLTGVAEGTLGTIDTVTRTLPETVERVTDAATDTLGNVSRLAGTADELLQSEAVARLPEAIEGTLQGVDGTLGEARGLLADVREGGAIESLNETLGFARGALANVSGLARTLPGTIDTLGAAATATLDDVSRLAGTAETTLASVGELAGSLPETVETLSGTTTETLGAVTRLAGTANDVLSSEAVARLPETIEGTLGTADAALEEARALVGSVRESGAIDALNATLRSAQGTLASVEASVAGLPQTVETLSAAATDTLGNVSSLAATANGVLAADGVARLPATLDGTLAEIQGLAAALREGGAVENVNTAIASAERALASAETTLASVDAAAQALPRQIDALATGASEALDQIGRLAETADGVLGAEGVAELPATLNGTLAELRSTAATLREGGAVESLNATLASARDTLASVEAAADTLPATVERLSEAADGALTNVSGLAETARGVLGADGVDRLPATLEGTLAELRALSADIRQGGAVESLNATLRTAEAALVSVDSAAQSLPALVGRLNSAADGLQEVVRGYSTDSRVYEDLRAVLREASATAEAFRSLARTIERRPNALLTGR